MNIQLENAIIRFRDDVYARRGAIDPNDNHDWHDLALGFFIACGIPQENLSWTFLADMANGYFDAHMSLPKDAAEWVKAFFNNNPEAVTVRLGYGWGPTPDSGPEVWFDAETIYGDHWSPPRGELHLTIPAPIIEWVMKNITPGEFKDFRRDP